VGGRAAVQPDAEQIAVKRIGFAIGAAMGLATAALLLWPRVTRESATPARVASQPPAAAPPPPSLDPGARAPGSPSTGSATVTIDADGVTVLAHGARRREILSQLSEQARFVVEDYTREDPEVTVRVIGGELTQAIAATLTGTPYTLHFGGENLPAAHDVRLLEVGVAPEASARKIEARIAELEARGQLSDDERDELEAERERLEKGEKKEEKVAWRASPELTPEQRAAWQKARAAREVEYRQEVLGELASEVGEDRKFALLSLDPTRPEDAALITAALQDADASVRSEAANQLRWAEPQVALPALTAALRDSSPDVVLAAIESLGDFDHTSLAEPLRELADHPDTRVRAAASELARRQ
jgi:hypothetical protein